MRLQTASLLPSLALLNSSCSAADCEAGAVRVFSAGEDAMTYGATGDDQCVHMCVPAMATGFIPGVEQGSCTEQGFGTLMIADMEIEVSGWPVIVSMYAKSAEGAEDGTDADPSVEEGAAGEEDTPDPTPEDKTAEDEAAEAEADDPEDEALEDEAPEDEDPEDSAAALAATGIATALAAVLALAA